MDRASEVTRSPRGSFGLSGIAPVTGAPSNPASITISSAPVAPAVAAPSDSPANVASTISRVTDTAKVEMLYLCVTGWSAAAMIARNRGSP